MNFRAKSVVAFLLVPWMPMLFVPVYIWMRGFYQNHSESFLTDALGISLGFGFLMTLLTFLLVITIVLPIWRFLMRSNRTGFGYFVLIGFGLAFLYSFLIIGILTGPGVVMKKDLSVLVLLCAVIGAVEASTFWLIVGPDKLTANKIVVE